MTYSCCHRIRIIMGIVYDVRLAEIASVEGFRKVGASSDNESLAVWRVFEEGLARGFWRAMVSCVIS